MIGIEISKEQIERAKKLYPFQELKGSITKGEGNLSGAIGEIVVNDYFENIGAIIDFTSTYDYDLMIDNLKVDVKTKKYTSKFKPSRRWTININEFNTTQKCDYYFFVGVADNYETAYLYGYITPESFYNKAIFNNKGDVDPNGNGLFKFKGANYNIMISELKEFKKSLDN